MLNVYLTFNGQTREAFDFYRSVFGGDFTEMHTFEGAPPDMGVPAEMKNRIMHVSLPVLGTTLMGSDSLPGMGPPLAKGNNFSISANVDKREMVDDLYKKMSEGGVSIMEPQETFWGSHFAMCRDRYDVGWMFNYDIAGKKP